MAERETRRLATQIFGPRYHFTDEGALLEAARGMLALGCDTIKFDCNPRSYPEGKNFCGSPAEALALPRYREVLNLPFRNYILWVSPDYFGDGPNWREEVYEEIYSVSSLLLREYAGTGKLFLLGNWEGDWVAQHCAYDHYARVSEADHSRMAEVYAIRQRAVEDARRDTPGRDVWVAHYVEVNLVVSALFGLPRLATTVLPKIRVDAVSYSCYDALHANRLTECLDFLARQANFTSYLDGMFAQKVFVGEFDAFRDYARLGNCSPREQRRNLLDTLIAAAAWGVPFALFWAYYNNEPSGVYKLVDESGASTHLHAFFGELLKREECISDAFCRRTGRRPTAAEFGQLAYLLHFSRRQIVKKLPQDAFMKHVESRK